MMTEEQTKRKWCPFARVSITYCPVEITEEITTGLFPPEHSVNRNGDDPSTDNLLESCFCVASECMSWRWYDGLSDDGTACHHNPSIHSARVPEPKEGRPLSERRGYCGLAGKP